MTTEQPEALRLADALNSISGIFPLEVNAANELRRLYAENGTLRHKLQTLEELGDAGDDVQILRMGYAAARLEIASLQAHLEAVGAGGVSALMGAPAQAATAKQSPHPEYDKGFSDGWNRCEARQAAAPAQAGEYPPLGKGSLWRDAEGIRGYGTDPGPGPWYTTEDVHKAIDTDRAARGAAQAAPVAWRYHCEGDPVKWYFSDTPSLLGLYQPLYASAQAAPVDAADSDRLDWLTFNLSGAALRAIGVVWSEHGDARRAIDAARAAQGGA